MNPYTQRLLAEAQKLYVEITACIQEIQRQLPYLYANTEHNSDVEFLTRSLDELKQHYHSGGVEPHVLYTRLQELYERARELQSQYVTEGERQKHLNRQIVEEYYTWCDQNIQSMFDKVQGNTTLEPIYDQLAEWVENFDPTRYSLRNVERITRLRDKVAELVRASFGPMQSHINLQDEECGICRTRLFDQPFCKLIPCEHLYHLTCIQNWILFKPQLQAEDKWATLSTEPQPITCPLCNTEVEHHLRYASN